MTPEQEHEQRARLAYVNSLWDLAQATQREMLAFRELTAATTQMGPASAETLKARDAWGAVRSVRELAATTLEQRAQEHADALQALAQQATATPPEGSS
jgi:hypothetical protein